MTRRTLLLALAGLWIVAACASAEVAHPESTVSSGPSASPEASPTSRQVVVASSPTIPPTVTPTRRVLPSASPSRTPSPTLESSPEPSATVTPEPDAEWVVFGTSVEGRPLEARRIGDGPFKVVLVGDIHGHLERNTYTLTLQLLDHFESAPGDVPSQVSLWLIPTLNPDGLAGESRFNAREVDLNRNADTDADGCATNDWRPDTYTLSGQHDGAGGAYPFSEPELQSVRRFLDDAHVAIFYHSAAGAIFPGGCLANEASVRLAEVLSEATGYEVPEGGWSGYPVTGGVADYLASEGVAVVELELTDQANPEWERNLAGVQAVLESLDSILAAEAPGAEQVWLDLDDLDVLEYDAGAFVHPLAAEVISETVYLVDGGRVLALEAEGRTPPRQLLAPGDRVVGEASVLPTGAESLPVLEPIALSVAGEDLLVLDRAGDVYRYAPVDGRWSLDRFDREVRDTYDHYFVALAASGNARFLMETTHEEVWRYRAPEGGASPPDVRSGGAAWAELPLGRDIDLAAGGEGVWALVRGSSNPEGRVLHFRDGRVNPAFVPDVELIHPLQIRHDPSGGVWVLDRMGRRLLELNPRSGRVAQVLQFRDRRTISAFWVDDGRLILAGRDRLYLYPGDGESTRIAGGDTLAASALPHDPDLLDRLRGLAVPIEGARVTKRDFQMPGAPRHYRLGVHEGLDWYSQTVAVPVNRQTPVLAVADGVVIRADLEYVSPTAAEMDAWLDQSRSRGATPEAVLDGYRGRQVWLEHGDGLISRYVHLGAIADDIVVGAPVSRGQVLGRVGNSGTPESLKGPNGDVHLHLELWLAGKEGEPAYYIGQFLRPIETRVWLERLLR
jgi:murein DD-endopeptidase MepM/ murein hydrolase activator NlpD